MNFPIQNPIKKSTTSVYPKYISLVKDNKRLEVFLTKLEENQNKTDILEFYTDIDNQIEVINANLMSAFKKQEDDLLNYYKEEMYKSQRHLKDLTEEMNEEKLRKRMNQRKEELQHEREELLRESLKLSNKCNEFKDNLKEVVGYSKEIEDELRFLDEQLIYADQQNTHLKQEVMKYQNEITKIDPDYQLDNDEEIWDVFNKGKHRKELSSISIQKRSHSMRDYESPYSLKLLKEAAYLPQTLDEFNNAKDNLKMQKKYNEKLKESLNHPCFEIGMVEKIFIESVEKIKKRSFDRFVKKNNSFLPGIKAKDRSGISEKDFSSSKIIKGNESLSTEMSLLSDMDMNDLDRRMIMEEFFNSEEIKKHIYGLLFESKSKNSPTTV